MKTLYGFRVFRIPRATALATLIGTVILTVSWAQANIVFDDTPVTGITYPNIYSAYISLNYTEADHHLVTDYGHPEMFSYPNPSMPGKLISFYPVETDNSDGIWGNYPGFLMDLTLSLDSNNLPVSGTGTLQILGTINYLGASSGTLLTGDLQQIIYDDPGGSQELRYVFNTTGGDLQGYYPSQILVIQDWTGYAGHFDQDFSSASSDSYAVAVPEPCSAVLLLISLGGILLVSIARQLRRN